MDVSSRTAASQRASASRKDARTVMPVEPRWPSQMRCLSTAKISEIITKCTTHRLDLGPDTVIGLVSVDTDCAGNAAIVSSICSSAHRSPARSRQKHQTSYRRAQTSSPRPSRRRGRTGAALVAGTRPCGCDPGRASKRDAPHPPSAAETPTDRAAAHRPSSARRAPRTALSGSLSGERGWDDGIAESKPWARWREGRSQR